MRSVGKRIFLHIGTFKTGSTALQFHMHKNRQVLLNNGYYYGDYFENFYLHSNLCYGLLREALQDVGIWDLYRTHPRFTNVAENPETIIKRIAINSADCQNIIISHEGFFADAFRTLVGIEGDRKYEEDINKYIKRRLKELLESLGNNITVICYLRRQDLFIESQYNQYCKDMWWIDQKQKCCLPSFDEFVACDPIHLNYFTVLKEWEEAFGSARFIVKPYDKKLIRKGFLEDFYTGNLGLSRTCYQEMQSIKRTEGNEKLDRDVLEYKRAIGITNPELDKLLKTYSHKYTNEREYAYFDVESRNKFLNQYEKENRKVAESYLTNTEGKLFEVDENIPEVYAGLSVEKTIDISRYLLNSVWGGVFRLSRCEENSAVYLKEWRYAA